MPAPFTLRRCFALTLPALVLGAILRIWMMTALPEGFFGPDSNSYFSTAKRLWNEHKWSVGEKRRWVYPVFLASLPPLPGTPSRTVPVVQHLCGLASLIGIGWIVGHVTQRRNVWVPLVTTLAAVWPLLLWYEQEVQAETMFASAFILAVAAFFPHERLREGRRLMWFLLAAALVLALKPHGRGIWLGCVAAAALAAGPPWRWRARDFAALGAGALVIFTAGSSRQGNWLLLSSVLPLVPTTGDKWPDERRELAPLIEETRAQLAVYPWVQGRYKKRVMTDRPGLRISDKWAALTKDRPRYIKVCGDFAREAIRAHPFEFARLTFTKCALAFSREDAPSRMSPANFWKEQIDENADRWEENPRELELFYGFDKARYDAVAEEGRRRTFAPHAILNWFARAFSFTRDGHEVSPQRYDVWPTWLGWLALGGLACALWRSRTLAILWLPLAIYLGSVFAVGDRVERYVQPVEWAGLVLAALALDFVCGRISAFGSKERTSRHGERLSALRQSRCFASSVPS
jgi:hypothetical protein